MQDEDDLFAPQSKKRNPLVMVGKHSCFHRQGAKRRRAVAGPRLKSRKSGIGWPTNCRRGLFRCHRNSWSASGRPSCLQAGGQRGMLAIFPARYLPEYVQAQDRDAVQGNYNVSQQMMRTRVAFQVC